MSSVCCDSCVFVRLVVVVVLLVCCVLMVWFILFYRLGF